MTEGGSECDWMRRTIAILLTAAALLSVSASGAEGFREWFMPASVTETATPAPNAFRFRDGIRWGMNKLQVKALETGPMNERSMQNRSVLFTDGKVAVSRFTADLVFMFVEERLMMISYEFLQGTQDSFQYLTGALSSLYGEKAEAEPMKIKALMDTIDPNRYRTEMIVQPYGWTYDDGTSVYLYYYSQTDFAILYVSPELSGGIYQTNGL